MNMKGLTTLFPAKFFYFLSRISCFLFFFKTLSFLLFMLFSFFFLQLSSFLNLKLLTNEKRGGLRVILFDRSPFKLFSRKFSKESVQAPSYERPRTAPRPLFVSFAINNCFQISVTHRSCMKNPRNLYATW